MNYVNSKLFSIVSKSSLKPCLFSFLFLSRAPHTVHTFDFLLMDIHPPGILSSWKVPLILDGLFQVEFLFVECTQFPAERINHFILSISMVF